MSIFPKHHIVITGPESTGKSWLAQKLSIHYETIWTPEYAREYLQNINRDYEEKDLVAIAKQQLILQQQDLKRANGILFSDTGLLVLKIWSEFKYGRVHPWIEKELQNQHYDLFLLCATDLPWVFDPLRENPNDRKVLFNLYKKNLTKLKVPFAIIEGEGEIRLQNAINAIELFLKKPS